MPNRAKNQLGTGTSLCIFVEVMLKSTKKGVLEKIKPSVVITLGAIHSGRNSTSQLAKGL